LENNLRIVKITDLQDVKYQLYEEPAAFIFRVEVYAEDGSSRLLRNFTTYLPNYMPLYTRTVVFNRGYAKTT
jgi:hypothetical protein